LSAVIEPLELDKKKVGRINDLLDSSFIGNVLALLIFAAIALDDLVHVRFDEQL
jgi:hypothetical protein